MIYISSATIHATRVLYSLSCNLNTLIRASMMMTRTEAMDVSPRS